MVSLRPGDGFGRFIGLAFEFQAFQTEATIFHSPTSAPQFEDILRR